MALLSLPNELLGRIVEETMPEGFETFVLSCKAVHQAGTQLIEEHNTLRRRYRHFRYEGNGNLSDQDTCASSLQLIARIAEDPRIAKYIVLADFKADGSVWDDGSIQNAEPLQEYVKSSSEFRALLEKSSYLRDTGDDASKVLEHLTAHFEPYEGTHILAATLLLTLLPNVTQLSLPKSWELWDDSNLWDASSLLDAIVKRANDPRDSAAGLSKLVSILPSTAWGYDNRWKLSTFTPFLSIESVREICAGSTRAIDDGYTGYPFDKPKFETFGRGLEVVELVGAVVDANELRKFLSRIPRLKAFRLSYETKWHGCGHDFDANAVMTAIENVVGDHLQELSFTILGCYGEIERVSSLKNFTILKELELDMAMMTGIEPGNSRRYDEYRIPVLSELCPSTIESLHLIVNDRKIYDKALTRLFSEKPADVKEKLPNLKQIKISSRYPRGLEADLNALESSIDVKLIFIEGRAEPEFMRDFCNRYDVETT